VGDMRTQVTLVMAVVLTAAGGVIIWWLFGQAGVDETTWQRYTSLHAGVEAVVFTAVGWLFGKEVHREQAATAEKERKAADDRKEQAVAAAAGSESKGRELARAIVAAAGGTDKAQTLAEGIGVGGSELATLVRHARSAYPEV
jgi:hypothetical protein